MKNNQNGEAQPMTAKNEDQTHVDKKENVIQEAIRAVKAAASDGFQWSDLKIYIGTVAIAIEQAGIFMTKAGKEKEDLLVIILDRLIDIPFMPDVMERWLFSALVGVLNRGIIRIFNKRGWNTKYLK